MPALGSLVLYCAWASGLVVAFLTIRSFEESVNPAGPRRRVPIALAAAVVGSLWLPWVTSADGRLTLAGWSALDAATVIAIVLLATGVAAIAALPDWGGERRDVHSLALSLSLLGIIAGNWLIGAGGGWGNDLKWGAAVSLATATTLAAVEAVHLHRGDAAVESDDGMDLSSELGRLNNLHY
jgi:hypothetical protein